MWMQSVIRAIYPSQCVACDAPTEDDFGLCGKCWRDTDFIGATICNKCGTPLPGDDPDDDLICDDCMTIARPWDHGRSVIAYTGIGRKLVLSLKLVTEPISHNLPRVGWRGLPCHCCKTRR